MHPYSDERDISSSGMILPTRPLQPPSCSGPSVQEPTIVTPAVTRSGPLFHPNYECRPDAVLTSEDSLAPPASGTLVTSLPFLPPTSSPAVHVLGYIVARRSARNNCGNYAICTDFSCLSPALTLWELLSRRRKHRHLMPPGSKRRASVPPCRTPSRS